MPSFELRSVFPIEGLERSCQWRELKPELIISHCFSLTSLKGHNRQPQGPRLGQKRFRWLTDFCQDSKER